MKADMHKARIPQGLTNKSRKPGLLKGQIEVSDDFNDTPESILNDFDDNGHESEDAD